MSAACYSRAPRSFSSNSLTRSNNSTSSSVHFQNSLLFLDVLLLRHFRAQESKAADEPHACAVRDVSVRMNSYSTENNSVDVATVRLCSSTHAGSSPAFVQRRELHVFDLHAKLLSTRRGSANSFLLVYLLPPYPPPPHLFVLLMSRLAEVVNTQPEATATSHCSAL